MNHFMLSITKSPSIERFFIVLFEKKYPRLLLAHREEDYRSMHRTFLVWPNGIKSSVFDISYAGLAVSSQGVLSTLKVGESYEVQLRIDELEGLPLNVKVVKIMASTIGLKIETTNIEGRLKLDQPVKEALIEMHTRPSNPEILHPIAKADYWFHGPFDTNLFIWKSTSGGISKAFIEYDNVLLIFEDQKFSPYRSSSASEEPKGYVAPYMNLGPKVSLGVDWLRRFKRLLQVIPDQSGILQSLTHTMTTETQLEDLSHG